MAKLTAQDYANVALGGLVLVATFLTGRIAVESILAHRREQFEGKGKSAPEVAARETTLDGVMKVVGTTYAIYSLTQDLPRVWDEAQKLLE